MSVFSWKWFKLAYFSLFITLTCKSFKNASDFQIFFIDFFYSKFLVSNYIFNTWYWKKLKLKFSYYQFDFVQKVVAKIFMGDNKSDFEYKSK